MYIWLKLRNMCSLLRGQTRNQQCSGNNEENYFFESHSRNFFFKRKKLQYFFFQNHTHKTDDHFFFAADASASTKCRIGKKRELKNESGLIDLTKYTADQKILKSTGKKTHEIK